jgi:hypothetical protein
MQGSTKLPCFGSKQETSEGYFLTDRKTMARTLPITFVLLLCTAALGWTASPAYAKNRADLVDIHLGQSSGNLHVSFRIQGCFTPKMEEAIRSGVSTSFRILVILEKSENPVDVPLPFLKSNVANISIEHTIKYDRLKNEFRVNLPEHPDRVLTTPDLEEAKQWMSSVHELSIIPVWRLQKDKAYQVQLKAELSKIDLPPFFRYVFFFVSLWDFETEWHKLNLTL